VARDRLSASEACRIALAAQGFDRPRPAGRVDLRHLRGTIGRLGLLQLDFVNVVVPAHYQVLFSRLGPYDRSLLDRLAYRRRELTEQWAHEASLVPVALWPHLAHRREDHPLESAITALAIQEMKAAIERWVEAVEDAKQGRDTELYASLWASCDELRGGMDASQCKDYVLVLLFIKYVSDKYAGVQYAPITIPIGGGFAGMVSLKGTSDIGDQINKRIIAPLASANKLSDMPDFADATKLGSGKELVDRLTNLIAIFENPALDFSKNRADGDDILGDAYEYLMRQRLPRSVIRR
jgi:hypothetical protein